MDRKLLSDIGMSQNQKMYAGRTPDEQWNQIGTATDHGLEWRVYSKAQDHSNDWLTYKIVANGRASGKANYWLARNNKTGRIGFARDYYLLQTSRPELFAQVEGMINGPN